MYILKAVSHAILSDNSSIIETWTWWNLLSPLVRGYSCLVNKLPTYSKSSLFLVKVF